MTRGELLAYAPRTLLGMYLRMLVAGHHGLGRPCEAWADEESYVAACRAWLGMTEEG